MSASRRPVLFRFRPLLLGCSVGAGIGLFATTPASAGPPYEGTWGAAKADCGDPDGVNRMTIKGTRFNWYESRCQVEGASQQGRTWTLKMACQGEGKKWRSITSLSLTASDRLVMANAPVGPTKRQVYVRCGRAR